MQEKAWKPGAGGGLCDEPLFSTRKSECLNGSWHDLCTNLNSTTYTHKTSSRTTLVFHKDFLVLYHKTTKFGSCQIVHACFYIKKKNLKHSTTTKKKVF